MEIAAVIVAGIALSALLYSEWFKACCESAQIGITILLFPAIFVAMIIGDGVHSATPIHFTIGVIVQLGLLWAVARFIVKWIRRRKADA